MNPPLLTLNLLNEFLELIISYQDFKQIDNEPLLELIKFIDNEERFWHVEDNLLYRRKAWIESEARKERKKREDARIQEIKDVRLRTVELIKEKLVDLFGPEMDEEKLFELSLNILRKGRAKIAEMLEIDIKSVPEMPTNYWIIRGNKEIKL